MGYVAWYDMVRSLQSLSMSSTIMHETYVLLPLRFLTPSAP